MVSKKLLYFFTCIFDMNSKVHAKNAFYYYKGKLIPLT